MPVTVALQAYALTTLQRVLDELSLSSDGDKVDSLLNGYINSASGWLKRHCSRTFQRSNAIDELVIGNGRTRIRIARPPIVSVTSVTMDDTTLSATDDYNIDDADLGWLYRRAGWTWSAAIAPGLDQEGVPGDEKRNIEVVYDGGFVTRPQNGAGGVGGDTTFVGAPITLPDELEDAVITLVSSRWLARGRDVRVIARSFESSGLTFSGIPVPAEVAAVVADYALIAHA